MQVILILIKHLKVERDMAVIVIVNRKVMCIAALQMFYKKISCKSVLMPAHLLSAATMMNISGI